MTFLALLAACSTEAVVTGGKEDGVADAAVDDAAWDGAMLVVTAPASGAFLPYAETATFSAEVRAGDGTVLDFDEIAWTSDVDAAWSVSGARVEDASLDVGTHAVTATAVLPNGDRLAHTVGGVLVQSVYTGVYTGTLVVTATGDYEGQTYSVGCSGALTLVVDAYGETAEGDAGCLLAVQGYELDTAYDFALENDGGALSGEASVDLQVFAYGVDTEGEVTEDGALEGAFSEDVYGYFHLDGRYEATRVTRDVSAYE